MVAKEEEEREELQHKLIRKISAQRARIKAYAEKLDRRSSLLTNLNIVCTGVSAVLTAGPALGGENFTSSAQQILGLATDSTVWKTLCLLALLLSLIGLIANNLYRGHELATRLAKAQTSSVLLEGLKTSIEFKLYSLEEATKLYQQYIEDVAFIPEK